MRDIASHYPIVVGILLSGLAVFFCGIVLYLPTHSRPVGRALCALAAFVTASALVVRIWFRAGWGFWSVMAQMSLMSAALGVGFALAAWPLYYCARRWPRVSFLVTAEFWAGIIGFPLLGLVCALAIRDFWRIWLAGDMWALLYIGFASLFPASWIYEAIHWLRLRRTKR